MPRKKKPKAAPQRPEIDYSRRGAELRDLKDVRVGDPYCRLILFALDNLIGSNFQYIDKTLEEIRELCEMSRTTFYDRVNGSRSSG